MRLSVCSTAKFFVLYFSLNKLNDGDNDRMKDSDNDRKSPTAVYQTTLRFMLRGAPN